MYHFDTHGTTLPLFSTVAYDVLHISSAEGVAYMSKHNLNGRILDIPDSKDENAGWARLGALVISFSKPGDTSDARFFPLVAEIGKPETTKVLAIGIGTVRATSVQRKAIADAVKDKTTIAVIDGNPIARGIITALGWFGANIKSYAWNELPKAAEAAAVPGTTTEEIISVVWKFRELLMGEKRDS